MWPAFKVDQLEGVELNKFFVLETLSDLYNILWPSSNVKFI